MTIKEIAALCGCSVTTVSRVLNNHPYVREEIRQKVLQVIEEQHFVPHNGAVDLAKNQPDGIGLVVRGIGNSFFSEMVSTIETAIMEDGYNFVLHPISEKDDEIAAAAALVKAKSLNGVILLGGKYDWKEEEFDSIKVPFVCCTFTNGLGERTINSVSSVSINDEEEACNVVQHLIDAGHRRIGIVLPNKSDNSVSELRYRGYCSCLANAGIELDESLVFETGSFSIDEAYETMCEEFDKAPEFTALFAISDNIGMAAIKALSKKGKTVPEDCSVIAIDGLTVSNYMIPTLTTMVQPKEELAIETVNALKKMIRGEISNAHIYLPARMREGESVKIIN